MVSLPLGITISLFFDNFVRCLFLICYFFLLFFLNFSDIPLSPFSFLDTPPLSLSSTRYLTIVSHFLVTVCCLTTTTRLCRAASFFASSFPFTISSAFTCPLSSPLPSLLLLLGSSSAFSSPMSVLFSFTPMLLYFSPPSTVIFLLPFVFCFSSLSPVLSIFLFSQCRLARQCIVCWYIYTYKTSTSLTTTNTSLRSNHFLSHSAQISIKQHNHTHGGTEP